MHRSEFNPMLDETIAELRALLTAYAEMGHTTECDILHSKLATLEEAKAICYDEDDTVIGLKQAIHSPQVIRERF